MQVNGVIQRKLALLDDKILWLERNFGGLTKNVFLEDELNLAAAERGLQVAVEIVIDIAERLVALHGAGPVASAGEAIEKLAHLGIVRKAEVYQQMVRFRNFIVHQYATVDPSIVYQIVTEQLADFRSFRDEIDNIC